VTALGRLMCLSVTALGYFIEKKENKGEEKQKSKGMVLDIAPLNDAQ